MDILPIPSLGRVWQIDRGGNSLREVNRAAFAAGQITRCRGTLTLSLEALLVCVTLHKAVRSDMAI